MCSSDLPLGKPESVIARADRLKGRWRLEVFLTAEALSGYDPETNRRLGFAYRITDPETFDECLGAGREFPVGENPSLWSTLELVDPD